MPTESSLTLANEIAVTSDLSDNNFLQIADNLGLWGNIKDPVKRLAKYTEDIKVYVECLQEAKDKTILSLEQDTKIKNAVYNLKTNRFTSKFYVPTENTECKFQVAFSFEFEDVLYKCMLDSILIDHEYKTVTPVDTKTMEISPLYFNMNVKKFRYDLQAELYKLGIIWWAAKFYPGYAVEPFMFSVISLELVEKPFVYKIDVDTWRILNSPLYKPLKSVFEITEDYKKQKELGDFSYPYEILTKGYLTL